METWSIADAERGGGTVSGQPGLTTDWLDDTFCGGLEAEHAAGHHGLLLC